MCPILLTSAFVAALATASGNQAVVVLPKATLTDADESEIKKLACQEEGETALPEITAYMAPGKKQSEIEAWVRCGPLGSYQYKGIVFTRLLKCVGKSGKWTCPQDLKGISIPDSGGWHDIALHSVDQPLALEALTFLKSSRGGDDVPAGLLPADLSKVEYVRRLDGGKIGIRILPKGIELELHQERPSAGARFSISGWALIDY